MAAMTTALTEFSDNGNSRTYTLSSHTAVRPQIVIQSRKPVVNGTKVLEDTIRIITASEDADGALLESRNQFSVTMRRPVDGQAAEITSILAILRDIVAGDEFGNTVNTQEFLV